MAERGAHAKRNDLQEFDALDPASKRSRPAYITMRRAAFVARRGKAAVMEMAYTVPEVLKKPTAIFEGIRWDEDEDKADDCDGWLCYVGRPTQAYINREGTPQPAWENEVFLVFVNTDWVAYGWGWEDANVEDSGLPAEYKARFCRRVYP